MPGCPPKVKSGPDLLIYTHLPPAERERYSSEASTTTTSIVQRFERGLNEVGVTVTQCSPLSILETSNLPLTRWSAASRWSRRRRSWAAAACSGAARWAWQWAGHGTSQGHEAQAVTLIFADGEEAVLRQRQPVLRRPQCWRHVSGEGATSHGRIKYRTPILLSFALALCI